MASKFFFNSDALLNNSEISNSELKTCTADSLTIDNQLIIPSDALLTGAKLIIGNENALNIDGTSHASSGGALADTVVVAGSVAASVLVANDGNACTTDITVAEGVGNEASGALQAESAYIRQNLCVRTDLGVGGTATVNNLTVTGTLSSPMMAPGLTQIDLTAASPSATILNTDLNCCAFIDLTDAGVQADGFYSVTLDDASSDGYEKIIYFEDSTEFGNKLDIQVTNCISGNGIVGLTVFRMENPGQSVSLKWKANKWYITNTGSQIL